VTATPAARSFWWLVDDAIYRLARATHDRNWVRSLCLKDLFHYAAKENEIRVQELRELLHLQVSAAAVVVDGGERAQNTDKRLAGTAGKSAPVEPPAPGKTLSPAEKAAIDRARAETEDLWSK
jgi:hypothetical protein